MGGGGGVGVGGKKNGNATCWTRRSRLCSPLENQGLPRFSAAGCKRERVLLCSAEPPRTSQCSPGQRRMADRPWNYQREIDSGNPRGGHTATTMPLETQPAEHLCFHEASSPPLQAEGRGSQNAPTGPPGLSSPPSPVIMVGMGGIQFQLYLPEFSHPPDNGTLSQYRLRLGPKSTGGGLFPPAVCSGVVGHIGHTHTEGQPWAKFANRSLPGGFTHTPQNNAKPRQRSIASFKTLKRFYPNPPKAVSFPMPDGCAADGSQGASWPLCKRLPHPEPSSCSGRCIAFGGRWVCCFQPVSGERRSG